MELADVEVEAAVGSHREAVRPGDARIADHRLDPLRRRIEALHRVLLERREVQLAVRAEEDAIGRAGLPVHLHIDGDPFPLSRARGLSAYRIVQEGITNALKHASASRVDVTLRYAPEELDIEVRDDGPGTSRSDGLGHGLVGIRERVKIFGGEMSAGAGPDGGFVLRARLPLGDEAS